MKGYQFFAEMPEERKSKSANKQFPFQPWTRATLKRYAAEGRKVNCVAVLIGENGRKEYNPTSFNYEAVTAIFSRPNSAATYSGLSPDYLRKRTTRIDEKTARALHPNLFAYLEQ